MSDFDVRINEYLDLINDALDGYLPVSGRGYEEAEGAMRYSVMNAGKRVRPVLTLEFCRLCGGTAEDALPFACAVEMIHCYSLIHDDLPCMDDDDLRRGKPSCHKKFGEATALLAGDALQSRAFELIAASDLGKSCPERALYAVRTLSHYAGIDGMVGGQVIDLSMEQAKPDADALRQMHRLKTGALIKAACTIGAACAGAGEKLMEKARLYGEALGLAFQLVDDILDVTGTEKTLGKPIGSDKEQGKTTFVDVLGVEETRLLAMRYTSQAMETLETFPKPEFLKTLTGSLLTRNA